MNWKKIPSDKIIRNTAQALKENGIDVFIVSTAQEAKEKALELIPKHAEVLTATSTTNDAIGLTKVLDESGKYNAIKPKLAQMSRETESLQMQKLGAAPEYVVGSVHAVTQKGAVLIASNSGSQLPAYSYGASHVIWVVGVQKIVKDFEEGLQRIYEYVLPLESKRAQKAYGIGSFVSKLLIFHKERSGRITLIFVKEVLGF